MMTTLSSEEVAVQFKAELRELLKKWDAFIEADDHYRGYPECGRDIRIEVIIPSEWNDSTQELVREYTIIDFGENIEAEDLE